jgi:hypothetical protein
MKGRLGRGLTVECLAQLLFSWTLFDGEALDVFVYSLQKSRCCR